MPLPSEDTTPPVMKMCLAMLTPTALVVEPGGAWPTRLLTTSSL